MFFWPLSFVFAATTIYYFITLFTHNNYSNENKKQDNRTPNDILIDRYVDGEITKKQFVELREELLRKTNL